MSASDFLCLYGSEAQKDSFDVVAAVFFLDTAPNIIRYIEVIRHCLRRGGLLINFGPLLWHFENVTRGKESGAAGHSHGNDSDSHGVHQPETHRAIQDTKGEFEPCPYFP